MPVFGSGQHRILCIDRAGVYVVFTAYIDCAKDAHYSMEFLHIFSRLSPVNRGIDTTAKRIPHNSALSKLMRRRAALDKDPGNLEDYAWASFEKSLKEDWPWFKLPVGEGHSRREFLVGAPHSDQKGTVFDAPGTRGHWH
ncbi:uncharacterized protein TRAVEDRAFT_52184 [Trametes versicolor FP-101664 SS1]|uniref:uncharacterized protein n=1 Tax=Trametes versicolor (strain FP-101664) TaxID=717944 RepID=UPI0004623F07|nr:uncharacterized protein TRAVEDRAFT_52184 [Trametes versicolor FP-101664 SS1]EIW54479.1 hypothetical protein TRAVEDRAFT_52184 [Trametes versicolor FP-101664 SS1]